MNVDIIKGYDPIFKGPPPNDIINWDFFADPNVGYASKTQQRHVTFFRNTLENPDLSTPGLPEFPPLSGIQNPDINGFINDQDQLLQNELNKYQYNETDMSNDSQQLKQDFNTTIKGDAFNLN